MTAKVALTANKDFDALNPDKVRNLKDKDGAVVGREGELASGQTVKVRNRSTDKDTGGGATLEVHNSKNNIEKFRYHNE